jgi:hypothetical protein
MAQGSLCRRNRSSPALAALIGKYHNAHYEDFPWPSHPKHPEMLSVALLREIMALSRDE